MQLNWLVGTAVALFAASAATAENWDTVYDEGSVFMRVQRESVHTGDAGLVYFYLSGPGYFADKAADCRTPTLYTLKFYRMNEETDHPKWREEGQPIVSGSVGETVLNYACAKR